MVNPEPGKFDWGFGIDMMYGSDARLIHANGLNGYNSFTHPINQFDLTQAYIDIVVPVGTGLRVRMGKFVNLVGYEAITPTVGGVIDHTGYDTTSILKLITRRFDLQPLAGMRDKAGDLTAALDLPR